MPGLRPTAMVTALCLGCWLGPGRAHAEPTVMVWPAEPEAPVAAAEDALQADGVAVVPQARVGSSLAEQRTARAAREQEGRARVEAALGAAQARYLELDLPGMIAELDAAEPDAVALARPDQGCEGLWELEFRQGLGRWARGDERDRAEADARFALALELDPERRPLGELYGPDVTAAFLGAVEQRSARIARPVSLRVQPSDATVEIDCRAQDGRAPALRPGLHAVRVAAPGFAPWSGVVDLRERASIDVVLVPMSRSHDASWRLAGSTEEDAVDDGSMSAHSLVMEVARASGAQAVLVVGRSPAGYRVRPWGRDGIGSAVERPELALALHAAVGLLDDDGRLHAPAPRVASGPARTDGRPTTPARKPVLRTWWFWTIVGSVVVTGGALGLGLGLGLREPAPGRLVVVAR